MDKFERASHRKQRAAAAKQWWDKHKDENNATRREQRRTDPSVRRRDFKARLRNYGLSWESYETILLRQSGRCPICGKELRTFHIDHNHRTGTVRGLLCENCNPMIGQSHENPDVLRAAARYLEVT